MVLVQVRFGKTCSDSRDLWLTDFMFACYHPDYICFTDIKNWISNTALWALWGEQRWLMTFTLFSCKNVNKSWTIYMFVINKHVLKVLSVKKTFIVKVTRINTQLGCETVMLKRNNDYQCEMANTLWPPLSESCVLSPHPFILSTSLCWLCHFLCYVTRLPLLFSPQLVELLQR